MNADIPPEAIAAAPPYLLGCEKALREWEKALNGGRLHHAWLLHGARGIGKKSLAGHLARDLLSIPPEARLESHPDLLLVEREWDDKRKKEKSFITVENVRRAADFFSRTSARGGWRVCILDSADDMNRNASNALLKILEEPPQQSVFLLISHQPESLLDTIRSRCRRLRLAPLEEEEMLGWLRREFPDMVEEEARLLFLLSGGSPGRACALREEGVPLYGEMLALLEGLPTRLDMAAVHDLGDRLSAVGQENLHKEFLELLRGFLERLVRAAAGVGGGEDRGGEGMPPAEAALLERLRPTRLEPWIAVWENIGAWSDAAERLQVNRKHIVLLAFAELESAAQSR